MKILSILLTVLFVGLKLTNQIDWPWVLVMSPLLVYISITLFLLFIFFGLALFANNVKITVRKKEKKSDYYYK